MTRVADIDVAVAAAGTAQTGKNSAHDERLSIDRSVLVRCDQDNGVPDLHVHAVRQKIRNEDLAGLQQAARVAGRDPALEQGERRVFFRRVDAVDPDAGGFGEVAEHGGELDARRIGHDIRRGLERGLGFRRHVRIHIQRERQIVDRRHVAFGMDLEMTHDRIGELTDHERLEGAGKRGEQQHGQHADGDQSGREKGAAPIADEVAKRDSEDAKHEPPPGPFRFLSPCRPRGGRRSRPRP